MVRVISIAARLNRLPPTAVHQHATAIAGIGSFFDLFDIFLAGVLATVLTQQFHLSRAALPPMTPASPCTPFSSSRTICRTSTLPVSGTRLRTTRAQE